MNFVKNFKKLGLSQGEVIGKIGIMTNNNAKSIEVVADKYEILEKLFQKEHKSSKKLDFSNLFRLTNHQATIMEEVLKKPDLYRINHFSDINVYTELNPKQFKFMQKSVMPKLEKYGEDLRIKSAYDISSIVKCLNPKTVDSIDIVAKYAPSLKKCRSHLPQLLLGITEENVKNVENGMKIIAKNSDTWSRIIIQDNGIFYKKFFDSLKKG